jgi:hypothetical protein
VLKKTIPTNSIKKSFNFNNNDKKIVLNNAGNIVLNGNNKIIKNFSLQQKINM